MTAKEKAEDIVDKYIQLLPYHSKESNRKRAIGSALIAVDEIFSNNTDESKHNYWIEVKQEIEKL